MTTTTQTPAGGPAAAPHRSGDDPGTTPRAGERAWVLVARREVMSKLTDKAFLLGTAITVLLVVGFVGWEIATQGDTETYSVAATAEAEPTARLLAEQVPEVDDELRVEVVEVDSDADGVAALEDESVDVLLRSASDGWTLVGLDEVPDELAGAATTVIARDALVRNARDAGTTADALQQGGATGTSLLRGDDQQRGFADLMSFALAFLFYMAALGFGYTLSGSIVEEKANRIVEIIATKIPVRQLLIGKIAGNTLLAIGQTGLVVGVGLIGISFTELGQYLPAASAGIGWFIGFFVVGFTFIACWWAVAGALASRAEDLQSTATPLTLLMMAVFFAAFLLEGTALTLLSYVPPFSCVLMPQRILAGDAAWWEPWIAIAVLVAAMASTVVLAERLYRRALLQTQGRVGLRQAWRTAE